MDISSGSAKMPQSRQRRSTAAATRHTAGSLHRASAVKSRLKSKKSQPPRAEDVRNGADDVSFDDLLRSDNSQRILRESYFKPTPSTLSGPSTSPIERDSLRAVSSVLNSTSSGEDINVARSNRGRAATPPSTPLLDIKADPFDEQYDLNALSEIFSRPQKRLLPSPPPRSYYGPLPRRSLYQKALPALIQRLQDPAKAVIKLTLGKREVKVDVNECNKLIYCMDKLVQIDPGGHLQQVTLEMRLKDMFERIFVKEQRPSLKRGLLTAIVKEVFCLQRKATTICRGCDKICRKENCGNHYDEFKDKMNQRYVIYGISFKST